MLISSSDVCLSGAVEDDKALTERGSGVSGRSPVLTERALVEKDCTQSARQLAF